MTTLEDRYRRLLLAYPAAYRAERGEEILDTLLELTPAGRMRPTLRDRRSLMIGGLRARAALNRSLPTWTNLRLAALLAVAMYLTSYATIGLSVNGESTGGVTTRTFYTFSWSDVLVGATMLAVIATSWFRRPVIGSMLAVAGAALVVVQDPHRNLFGAIFVLALGVLAWGKSRPPRAWLWLIGLAVLNSLLVSISALIPIGDPNWALRCVGIGVVLWAVVDPRPALAASICVFFTIPEIAIQQMNDPGTGPWGELYLTFSAITVALLIPALIRMRVRPRL